MPDPNGNPPIHISTSSKFNLFPVTNRPGVAGAVLQTPLSLIHSVI